MKYRTAAMIRRTAAVIAAAILLLTAAEALGQSLATDRQVLAPGTWRARTGQAAVLASEVRMGGTGTSLQAWADDREGSARHPFLIASTPALNTYVTPGLYSGNFAAAPDRPTGAIADALLVTTDPTRSWRGQALIQRGWNTVWTRRLRSACPDPCQAPAWHAWIRHDLSTGLTADQVQAAIAAQEGQQSSTVLEAILGLLLVRTGDTETFNISGALGPAVAGEDLGSRLDADDDEVIRLDVQLQDSVTGAVTATYDPILVVRADILALTDSGSAQLLNAAGEYREYPLRKSGVPGSQAIRVGRNGSNLVLAFGAAANGAYRVTASGLGEHVDAEAVASALRSLPTGSVNGHALSDVPVSYGATLPTVATATPGALFVQETAGKGNLLWMRPAGSAPTPARNRVTVVAQAQAGSGLAYGGWVDPTYDPSKTPDNYNELLGGLSRIHVSANPDRYVYSIYLRDSMLAGMGINADSDNTVKFSVGLQGEMRAFKRFSANDPQLGQTVEVTSRGITYIQFRTDPGDLPGFTVGTTYTLLFWAAADNSAINFKPATSRAPAAWEPPVPAPVHIGDSLPAIVGYRLGDQFLLRGGQAAARTWTLYILTPNEAGDPSAWTRPS